MEKFKIKVVQDDQFEYSIYMEDGGTATVHHNGEHMITTYYQNRLKNFNINDLDNIDFDEVTEGNAYIKDWESKQDIDQEIIYDAINWLYMFIDMGQVEIETLKTINS